MTIPVLATRKNFSTNQRSSFRKSGFVSSSRGEGLKTPEPTNQNLPQLFWNYLIHFHIYKLVIRSTCSLKSLFPVPHMRRKWLLFLPPLPLIALAICLPSLRLPPILLLSISPVFLPLQSGPGCQPSPLSLKPLFATTSLSPSWPPHPPLLHWAMPSKHIKLARE